MSRVCLNVWKLLSKILLVPLRTTKKNFNLSKDSASLKQWNLSYKKDVPQTGRCHYWISVIRGLTVVRVSSFVPWCPVLLTFSSLSRQNCGTEACLFISSKWTLVVILANLWGKFTIAKIVYEEHWNFFDCSLHSCAILTGYSKPFFLCAKGIEYFLLQCKLNFNVS